MKQFKFLLLSLLFVMSTALFSETKAADRDVGFELAADHPSVTADVVSVGDFSVVNVAVITFEGFLFFNKKIVDYLKT